MPRRLREFLATTAPQARGVLIPGCGSGYEVVAFAEAGWEVTAIDFSEAALERARANAGVYAGRIRFGDFFSAALPLAGFDLVYERTFLCALPRPLWPAYGPRVAALLAPGGTLTGFFFFDSNERGPPFGLAAGQIESLLAPNFERMVDQPIPASDSVEVLAGRERWQEWRVRQMPGPRTYRATGPSRSSFSPRRPVSSASPSGATRSSP